MFIAGAKTAGDVVNMRTIRVDDVVHGHVDIVKIDVEGHEKQALDGMRNVLGASRPIIFSEINEYWLTKCTGITGREYVEYLESLGYEVYPVTNTREKLQPRNLRMGVLETLDIVAVHRTAR
jgi:hypothetical protein